MREGGFNLRKFTTNSRQLQQVFDQAEGGMASTTMNDDGDSYTQATLGTSQSPAPDERKVLGVRWDMKNDEFVFDPGDIATIAKGIAIPTKRQTVSLIGRFYDPLGVLTPVIVQFKMYFQDLSQPEGGWDHPITGDTLIRWNQLISRDSNAPDLLGFPAVRVHAPVTGFEAWTVWVL